MKRKLLLISWVILNLGIATVARAQNPHEFRFSIRETDKKTLIRENAEYIEQDTAIYGILYLTSKKAQNYIKEKNVTYINNMGLSKDISFRSPIILGTRINSKEEFITSSVKSISKVYTSYVITDTADATIVAMGINKSNVGDYRYRVIENDSATVVPWSKVPLQMKFGALQPCGYLGKYLSPGKQLLVEVENIQDHNIRDGILLDWRKNFKPILTQITISQQTNNPYGDAFNINNKKANRGYATKFSADGIIPLDFSFPQDSISMIRFDFKHHETVPYEIHVVHYNRDSTDVHDDQIAYYVLTDHFDVDSKYFKEPGGYEIYIKAIEGGKKNEVIHIPFNVKPPPLGQKKVSLKQILPYAIATLLGFAIVFFIYRRQSRARLQRIQRDKEMVGLKLRSVRAQLNPHFMFNALTSIQNLINKNNISGANYYLSKFAGLTRQVLDGSNEEMISLEDEIQVLDDYLQMEQLRFNFKYSITTDDELDIANMEIPAMLLQPFVENAIKHGIATLGADGLIEVKATKQQQDLLLSITDNGIGFTPNGKADGYGIKLSEDRVALLNQMYPGQTITLQIVTRQPGTQVTICLTNWIS